MNKPTTGAMAWNAVKDSDFLDHSPEEQMRAQLEDYEKNMIECIDNGKKLFDGDFYIVVETKKEPKLNNVIRCYFIPRISCPTPTYDNAVYKYHRSCDELEFLWNLPDKKTYTMMLDRVLEIPDEQKELLQFILDDADGTLLKRCKQLNGEI